MGQTEPASQRVGEGQRAEWWEGGKKVQADQPFETRQMDAPKIDKLTRNQSGRRRRTLTDRKRGRYIKARPVEGRATDLAFDATLRAAAPYQTSRDNPDVAFAIEKQDLHRKVRVKKQANLILFVVDASWSMAVSERMNATKGAILSLLTDAYQRRDRVGLVVFQKDRATLVLPPTNSVQLAQRALADIPVGGKTPLSAGLLLSFEVIQKERLQHPDVMPLMVLLTDGAGNVSIGDLPPQKEAHQFAEQFVTADIRSVVINMEHAAFDQGYAQKLADHLHAPCLTLSDLRADTLYRTVKNELDKS